MLTTTEGAEMSPYKLAFLCVASLSSTAIAFAQMPPTPPTPPHFDAAAMHREMCGDLPAFQAARLAFIETKLELTDAQKPLFTKWRQAVLDGAAKEKAACVSHMPKADSHPSLLDHVALEESRLTAKLQALQGSHPALQSFYDSLTPAQKQIIDHPHHRGMHGRHGMERGMMEHHDGGHDMPATPAH